ncbi:brassinosteroid-responsive RING protein 1-like [Gastrolobium bilobum]|uniref:brassinosteroid-responsive RING protein 1-like n=1 Tax=Gastrolobium bilobum TaxID=150636 RepID=UPI002AB232C3|nr:brassinosteroid-responsive RING protein 1-like [Gastrolobium bilobum]
MGFPVGYPEVLVPNLFLHFLTLLGSLRSLVFSLLHLLRLSDFLDAYDAAVSSPESRPVRPQGPTLSALLIREFLPVVSFLDLAGKSPAVVAENGGCCAVCLSEFSGEEEIRCMANCKHIFHRVCVDRWIDHDQKTCPLCRTHFVPHHKMASYYQRLWTASGVSEFNQDDFTVSP